VTSPLANRVSRIQPSVTLAITARANQIRAEGGDILNLAAGEPDFDTPEHIKEAAIQAIFVKSQRPPVAESRRWAHLLIAGSLEKVAALIEAGSDLDHFDWPLS
jgi:hypothetical protein